MPSHTSILFTPRITRRFALKGGLALFTLPAISMTLVEPVPAPPAVGPRALAVPGGVVRLSLGPAAVRPIAHDGEVPVLVQGDVIEWTALVGVALSARPGEAAITVQTPNGTPKQLSYIIVDKKYREQRLKVAPGTVDLSPQDMARYEQERAHQLTVMTTFSEPLPPESLHMQVPTPGRRSSSFGLRRVFNGQSRNPHSGGACRIPQTCQITCDLRQKKEVRAPPKRLEDQGIEV